MNIAQLSIKRPVFITCIFLLTLGVGYLSLRKLPIDLFPDVTFPVVTVTTQYTGAGPEEVETLISKPIEDEISSIAGLKAVRSSNREGVSTVTAEFSLKTDVKYAEQQVRDRVSAARRKLPEDALDSVIRRIDPADQAIVTVGVSGPLSPAQLFDVADEIIRPKLQQVDQVGLVEINGGRKREIRVELDQRKLREAELSASQVADQIASAGENVPAGTVDRQDSSLVYRTLAQFRSVQDIESTIVSFFANERPIRVKDVGRVVDDLQEETSRVFFNGNRSLILQIYKQSGSNTIAVVDAIKAQVQKINEQFVQDKNGVELRVFRDNSKRIRANIFDVRESIFVGVVLTIIVVLFFLGNVQSTFVTSLALPNSLLGAFILMAWAGFTVNTMSLLALSLAVGLLIDDAIVVRENIFRHMEMGKSPREAAIDGTQEVLLAVIATTLTVIAVFGPIGFLEGMVGQFFKEFGLTICFAMMISLLDAVTMAPMLSAHFGAHAHNIQRRGFGKVLEAFGRFQDRLEIRYEKAVQWALRFPKTVLLIAVIIFAVSLYITRFIPKTFVPPQDDGEFNVSIELPPGTALEGTHKVAIQIDKLLREQKEVEQVLLIVGSRGGQSNRAVLLVHLVPSSERSVNTTEMKNKVRGLLKPFQAYSPIVTDPNPMGARERPFSLNILGSDLTALEAYAEKVYEKLKLDPSLNDVETSFKPGMPEYQFFVDPEKAERLGVSTKTAGFEIRTLIEGVTPAVFRENGREYDIRVRLQESERSLKERFDQVYVPNINRRLIPLSSVATPTEKTGPAEIMRQNRSRTVSLGGDIAPDGPGMGGAIQSAQKILNEEVPIPSGMTYTFVGQAENFKELMVNMTIAMALGVLFIYLVLASLYESFITPFSIMLVLPLAICGAFYALLITGKSLDIFSMIGCVLLLGVATKNSILLVDYTQQLMAEGMERNAAIVKSARTRLRPILMTSFALIAGMLPIAIGLNEASRQRTGMGTAIIGGLISSTALTLLVVPAAYGYIDRFGNFLNRLWKKYREN